MLRGVAGDYSNPHPLQRESERASSTSTAREQRAVTDRGLQALLRKATPFDANGPFAKKVIVCRSPPLHQCIFSLPHKRLIIIFADCMLYF